MLITMHATPSAMKALSLSSCTGLSISRNRSYAVPCCCSHTQVAQQFTQVCVCAKRMWCIIEPQDVLDVASPPSLHLLQVRRGGYNTHLLPLAPMHLSGPWGS